jgi:DNA-binding IscR family transcriptional regulator
MRLSADFDDAFHGLMAVALRRPPRITVGQVAEARGISRPHRVRTVTSWRT